MQVKSGLGGGDVAEFRLDTALCFHLYAASHAMTRFYRPYLDALGLSYPQFLVLMALWQEDHRSVKALGEALYLDSGTLSPVIKRLVALELVTKTRSDQDERQVDVSLTAKGRAIEAEFPTIGRAILCQAELSPAEMGELVSTLDRLIGRLQPEDGAR